VRIPTRVGCMASVTTGDGVRLNHVDEGEGEFL
jgi:hypothetical protein